MNKMLFKIRPLPYLIHPFNFNTKGQDHFPLDQIVGNQFPL